MAGTKDKFILTDLQEKFVDAFTGEAEFDAIESCRIAGYRSSSNPYSAARRVLESEAVRRAIHKRMHGSKFWLTEEAIIDRLWKEGMEASGASSRINALVWVGKHLGMWRDKSESEEKAITYNVINYKLPESKMVETIENKPEVKLEKLAELPEGVVLVDYKEPKEVH